MEIKHGKDCIAAEAVVWPRKETYFTRNRIRMLGRDALAFKKMHSAHQFIQNLLQMDRSRK